jgi:G3E family GTPase
MICCNSGYDDKGFTAKAQAKVTDLILINKHELVSPSQLEVAMDDVWELNPDTAKVKTDHGFVPRDVILGLHNSLLSVDGFNLSEPAELDHHHHSLEVHVVSMTLPDSDPPLSQTFLNSFLGSLSKDSFYRVKGCIHLDNGTYILNWAFGVTTYYPLKHVQYLENSRISFVGPDVILEKARIAKYFNLNETDLVTVQ